MEPPLVRRVVDGSAARLERVDYTSMGTTACSHIGTAGPQVGRHASSIGSRRMLRAGEALRGHFVD
jgi:hypothetical protein